MKANHADLRIVQRIASKYYDLNISADGALICTKSPDAPNPMTPVADSFLTTLKAVFDRIPLDIAEGPVRTAYAQCALKIGRTGLQVGNLKIANQQLDELNLKITNLGNAQYYTVSLEDGNNLQLKPSPWAPRPMPEDVIAFANRVERRFNKVKRLFPEGTRTTSSSPAASATAAARNQRKQSQYLRTLRGYAELGLEEGDIKSANSGLERFEAQFVEEEGPVFRSEYVSSTLRTAIYTFVGASVLGIAYTYTATSASWPDFAKFDNFIPAVLSVVMGICLGISFFAFVRNLNLTFDSLGHFDPANLSTVLRFLLVGIIALILCIVLKAGLIKFEVAGLKLDEFMDKDHKLTAVILGMICGYSDAAITRTLSGVLNQKT